MKSKIVNRDELIEIVGEVKANIESGHGCVGSVTWAQSFEEPDKWGVLAVYRDRDTGIRVQGEVWSIDPPSEVLCPICPLCGHEPSFVLAGNAQAFCGNSETCQAISWDPSRTALQNCQDIEFVAIGAEDPRAKKMEALIKRLLDVEDDRIGVVRDHFDKGFHENVRRTLPVLEDYKVVIQQMRDLIES